MQKLSTKLVMILLLLIVLTTIITTLAFFQIEKKAYLQQIEGGSTAQGKIAITILDKNAPKAPNQVSMGTGKVAIEVD